jgi:ubiquinone/menaquinone biosynthesis C-methylase UbiE
VEPNKEFLKKATSVFEDMASKEKSNSCKFKFMYGLSHSLPLEDQPVDILTVSQALHWLNPEETFKEVNRVLKPGGFFASIDCDWFASVSLQGPSFIFLSFYVGP